ncbi:hypothetical protein N7474_000721 [Penicillium riverlandense]|uniref:uncharacterized protein n=1 Tax=Penicillium riverlandense TaxID=1903569 RepID=UPI002546732E|nr:uncharacterized protein N7474_000721 [Penicillium riverlandense]KAJ5832410.1 hypothetical protein N7474_000721 [Penicillium riverlandense]
MSTPQLHMNLDGHCTAIYDNTLYAFAFDRLASISLEENGTWQQLPKAQNSVSGAACVVAGIERDPSDKALYVIGGSGASSQYSGLQRFSFKDQKWQTLQTPSTMMNNRTGHNAAYMESPNSILVYAGGQGDGTGASAQTYIVSTVDGQQIQAPVNSDAPAAYQPSLLTWSDSEIALIADTSTDVFLYNAISWEWENSQVTLPSTIASSTRCALVSNSDGSKVLESFDMSDTTNPVSSLALLSAGGKPESPASPVDASQKRSLSDHPYNGEFAPKTTLSDYSLAQGDNGMVAILSSSGDNTLAIFNTSSNSWVNTAAMFNGNSNQNVLKPTHTTTTMTTSTSTSSPTTSTTATNTSSPLAVAAPSSESPVSTNVIIGATLGGVLGFALILGILLLLLRRRVKRQQAQEEQSGGRGSRSGKHQLDRLSFQDQGIEPLTLSAFPMAKSPVPLASTSGDSSVMYGRTGEKTLKPPGTGVGYGLSPASAKDNNSPLSTIPSSRMGAPSVYTGLTASSDAAGKETPNQPGNRSTDEGWSKYFQGNNATNLASNRSTVSSSGYTKSDYRNSEWPMSTLPPLNLGFLDQHTGRVVSGSPTTEHTSIDRGRGLVIPESQSARISSADSISLNSDGEEKDAYGWTSNSQQSWLGRPPSSQYSATFYNDTQTLPGTVPRGNGMATERARASGRKSSVVIPDDIDELPVSGRSDNLNSDMSWLNLHAER